MQIEAFLAEHGLFSYITGVLTVMEGFERGGDATALTTAFKAGARSMALVAKGCPAHIMEGVDRIVALSAGVGQDGVYQAGQGRVYMDLLMRMLRDDMHLATSKGTAGPAGQAKAKALAAGPSMDDEVVRLLKSLGIQV